jgi:hypothetical protein
VSPSDVSSLERGSVYLLRFPFSDGTDEKRRPAILLTDASLVRGPEGVFVFMGSQAPPGTEPHIEVLEGSSEAHAMGLKFPPDKTATYVRPWKLATIPIAKVTRRLGVTPTEVLASLEQAVRVGLGLS